MAGMCEARGRWEAGEERTQWAEERAEPKRLQNFQDSQHRNENRATIKRNQNWETRKRRKRTAEIFKIVKNQIMIGY